MIEYVAANGGFATFYSQHLMCRKLRANMTDLPVLRFNPILREYLWGGRRLGTDLGKPIGDGSHYAESWEVVDHGADQSTVAGGSLFGKTLHDIVEQAGPALFGRHHPRHQFPLLLKFLDCQQ